MPDSISSALDSTSRGYNSDIAAIINKYISSLDISNNNDDDDLFKDPPPKEDCPICMVPMPHENGVCGVCRVYQACCGKMLCTGCMVSSQNEMRMGRMKQWCPYCRVPLSNSDQEDLKRFKKRTKLNDAEAFFSLGMKYHYGKLGLLRNVNKACELANRAAELGSVRAHYNLFVIYWQGDGGIEKDTTKAMHHMKLAAIGGHEIARHYLGNVEVDNGNMDRAMKHYMIAAKSGLDDALKEVGEGYKAGHVTKDDYANTLRVHKASQDEMKSEERTLAASIEG